MNTNLVANNESNNILSVPDTLSDWNTLQLAIAMTESEFNPKAVGKTKDYGIYQITPIYVKEVNRLLGNQVYTHNQAFDIEKSVEMFNILQSYKNPDQDINKAIYYHNKADWYRKKVLKNYETVKRYETLRAVLQEYI
jgi:predicted CoA-binding protein